MEQKEHRDESDAAVRTSGVQPVRSELPALAGLPPGRRQGALLTRSRETGGMLADQPASTGITAP